MGSRTRGTLGRGAARRPAQASPAGCWQARGVRCRPGTVAGCGICPALARAFQLRAWSPELARGLPKPLRDELWAQSRSQEADFMLGCCLLLGGSRDAGCVPCPRELWPLVGAWPLSQSSSAFSWEHPSPGKASSVCAEARTA